MHYPNIPAETAKLALEELDAYVPDNVKFSADKKHFSVSRMTHVKKALPVTSMAFKDLDGHPPQLVATFGDLHLLRCHLTELIRSLDGEQDKREDPDPDLREYALEDAERDAQESAATTDWLRQSELAPPLQLPHWIHSEWIVASEERAQNARQRGSQDARDKNRRTELIDSLLRREYYFRRRIDAEAVEALDLLVQRFPNFKEAIASIVADLSLRMVCNEPMKLEPLLLLGPPGIGKTAFIKAVAETLDFYLVFRSLPEMSASFILSGSSSTWSSSGPGLIADTIASTPYGKAPLFLIDELDKNNTSQRSPLAPLLGILEGHTASHFLDEYLELEMDIRPMSWMFTANEVQLIPAPILSRLKVVRVEAPSAHQMPAIVASVDADIRQQFARMDDAFAPLSDLIKTKLGTLPPRQVGLVLRAAYASCARRLPGAGTTARQLTLQDLRMGQSFLVGDKG